MQSFSSLLYARGRDISLLRHHSDQLKQSSVAETVGRDVQELTDRWNRLVGETNDREVRTIHFNERIASGA